MPLSEHEQRVLEEIERSLLEDDPKFASAVRSADPRKHAVRRALWGGALFVLGVSVLVLGLVTQIAPGGVPVVALSDFALMFLAAVVVMRAYRKAGRSAGESGPDRSGKGKEGVGIERDHPKFRSSPEKGQRASFLDRLEERWRRRRGQTD